MNIIYNGEKDTRQCKPLIGETIGKLIREDNDVLWLDADLMGCSGTAAEMNKDWHYINCGIAEANMAGIASGLSCAGFKPYCHSFGPFASRRCFDQVFLSAGYGKNPITVIGTDPGVHAAFNGGTHMPFEDMALYRTIPEAIVVDITDIPMMVDIMTQAKDLPGVKYIRIPRKETYPVYEEGTHFTVGKGNVLRDGKDGVIIACGMMVHEAMQASMKLEKEGLSIAVIDPFTVKPLDTELIRKYAETTGLVVTAENHNRIGGLTSAVEAAIAGIPCRFGFCAVEDEFGEVGDFEYLRERFKLTDSHIIEIIRNLK